MTKLKMIVTKFARRGGAGSARHLRRLAALAAVTAVALIVTANAQSGGGHIATAAAPPTSAQPPAGAYRVYTADGEVSTVEAIVRRAIESDAVFLGEEHNDPVAHALQLEILRRVFETNDGAAQKKRPLALSLEMFERDVQTVVDEYLKDLITEEHFKLSGRAWKNYATDYRPLVEFAKRNRIGVIAANAPRRYVNRAGRLGRASLDALPAEVKRRWLAPPPYGEASPAYAARFRQVMSDAKQSAPSSAAAAARAKAPPRPAARANLMLDAQTLWDATMAHSIAAQLSRAPQSLVIHLNGKFHSEARLGTPEHLARYAPAARSLVVTIISNKESLDFDRAVHAGAGDFVIVTDGRVPRSFQTPGEK